MNRFYQVKNYLNKKWAHLIHLYGLLKNKFLAKKRLPSGKLTVDLPVPTSLNLNPRSKWWDLQEDFMVVPKELTNIISFLFTTTSYTPMNKDYFLIGYLGEPDLEEYKKMLQDPKISEEIKLQCKDVLEKYHIRDRQQNPDTPSANSAINVIIEITFRTSKTINWAQQKLTPLKLLDLLCLKTSYTYSKIVITQNKRYHSNKFHFYLKNWSFQDLYPENEEDPEILEKVVLTNCKLILFLNIKNFLVEQKKIIELPENFDALLRESLGISLYKTELSEQDWIEQEQKNKFRVYKTVYLNFIKKEAQ